MHHTKINDNDDIFPQNKNQEIQIYRLLVITKDTSVLAALVITMYWRQVNTTITCTTMLPELEIHQE